MSALDMGLLLLGLAVGLTLAAHGAQKGLGWFGGPGMQGWTGAVASMGFIPAAPFAWAAMLGELFGGLGLAFGLLTSVAAALVVAQMVVIVFHVHWRHGFWNTDRGIEYPLVLAMVAVFLGLVGRGTLSLDGIISSTHLLTNSALATAPDVVPPIPARIALLLAGTVAGSLALAANALARSRGSEGRPPLDGPGHRMGRGGAPR